MDCGDVKVWNGSPWSVTYSVEFNTRSVTYGHVHVCALPQSQEASPVDQRGPGVAMETSL